MKLYKNEWIMVGSGKLFSAPFVSRVLLYRLHDIKSSLLVYHDSNYIVTDLDSGAMAGKIHGLPGINVGHIVMAKQVCESPIISIHYCPTSCSIAFEELIKLPARRLSFEECVSNENFFENIRFRIEPYSLPFSKRLIGVYQNRKTVKYSVEDSGYTITGPLASTDWPDKIAKEKIQKHCWKIQLDNVKSKTKYEVGECSQWSLAALKVSEEDQLDTAVYLGKND